ncbi:component of SufBCD complex [Primorskyibacter aestuariivivens]|uniref:component of SufBCD complex n=1 Tax=Primorskyibacter aestuariivivens TaxID=1888912 RepID=UPI0022FFE2EC|nr:component of SufBCD complex [Primorskyibacter aestuariivivens]MDA7430121.1 component of SufBCD complex [Primorskyibacter aestuariivivens]
MRSFSNLWFWIALAVMWSTVSHWVLGVPFDMIVRARRHEGQAQVDLEDLVRINTGRLLYIGQMAGLWLLGLACFVHSSLIILGFVYWMEFAQAVFLLLFPMTLVWLLSLNTARLIVDLELAGEDLRKRLTRHRLYVQMLGVVSIFITAMFGMYMNFTHSILGG